MLTQDQGRIYLRIFILFFKDTEGFAGEIWAIKRKNKDLSPIHKYFITIP